MKENLALFLIATIFLAQFSVVSAGTDDYNISDAVIYFEAGNGKAFPTPNIALPNYSDITFSQFNDTSFSADVATVMKDFGGVGLFFSTSGDTYRKMQSYPIFFRYDFTMPSVTKDINSAFIQISDTQSNPQEALAFYFNKNYSQNEKDLWRMFQTSGTKIELSNSDDDELYANRKYSVTAVIDIPGKKANMKVVEADINGVILETYESVDVDLTSLYGGKLLNGIGMLKFLGAANTSITAVKFGFIPVAPTVCDVYFDGTKFSSSSVVPRSTNEISVEFSLPMDDTSFEGNVTLEASDGMVVQFSGAYDSQSNMYKITDFGTLYKNETYILKFTDGIKNSIGTSMEEYQYTFTTDNSGAVVKPSISLKALPKTVEEGNSLTLAAIANGGDGRVSKVEFFDNGEIIGTDYYAPYEIEITNITAGMHNFVAKLTSSLGETAVTSTTLLAEKYINGTSGTSPVDTTGYSMYSTADRVVVTYNFTLSGYPSSNILDGRIRSGAGSDMSDYISVWRIGKGSTDGTLYGMSDGTLVDSGFKLDLNTPYTITTVVDCAKGYAYTYFNNKLISTNLLTKTTGLVRADFSGDTNVFTSKPEGMVAWQDKNLAAMPVSVSFVKNDAEIGSGALSPIDIDRIIVGFNKDLSSGVFDGNVILKDSGDQIISITDAIYSSESKTFSFKPMSIFEDGKTYTITFKQAISVNFANDETITFTALAPYRIDKPKVSSDGAVSALLVNNTGNEKQYILVVAAYSDPECKELADILICSDTLAANTTTIIPSIGETMKFSGYSSSYKIKFMLWDGFLSMIPLADTEIPK